MQPSHTLLLQIWKGEKNVSLHSPDLMLDGFEGVMLLLLFQVNNLSTPSNSQVSRLPRGRDKGFLLFSWLLKVFLECCKLFSGV